MNLNIPGTPEDKSNRLNAAKQAAIAGYADSELPSLADAVERVVKGGKFNIFIRADAPVYAETQLYMALTRSKNYEQMQRTLLAIGLEHFRTKKPGLYYETLREIYGDVEQIENMLPNPLQGTGVAEAIQEAL